MLSLGKKISPRRLIAVQSSFYHDNGCMALGLYDRCIWIDTLRCNGYARGGALALLGSDASGRPLLARLLPLAGFDFGPDLLNGLVYIALEVLGNAQDRILSGEAVCADGPH